MFNYSKKKATATVVNKLVLKWEIKLDYLNEHNTLTSMQNRKNKGGENVNPGDYIKDLELQISLL